MPDDKTEPVDTSAVRNWLRSERQATDRAIDQLRNTGSAEGIKGTTIEAAIVGAQSNRELSAAVITAAGLIERSAEQVSAQIEAFTTKADQGTNRLALWTMMLAIVTALLVIAAFVQAWATWFAAQTVRP